MALIPFPSQVEQWRDLFASQAPDLPTDFLLAWLANESGGNPCALGIPGVEAGMFQTFHPADDRFGATFAQLRAGCTGGAISDPSAVNRELQVQSGMNFVRSKRDAAAAHLAAVQAFWPQDSVDFWTMVKQEHALPCAAVGLLPRVAAKLGHPPESWDEFKATALAMSPSEMDAGCARFASSPSLHGLQNRLADTFRNAEETGKFGGGVRAAIGKLGKLAPFLLLGAAGTLLYLMWED